MTDSADTGKRYVLVLVVEMADEREATELKNRLLTPTSREPAVGWPLSEKTRYVRLLETNAGHADAIMGWAKKLKRN